LGLPSAEAKNDCILTFTFLISFYGAVLKHRGKFPYCYCYCAIGKLKSYKSPGTDQIPAELIKAGDETLYSEIHRLICSIWNKEELPQQWKVSIIVPVYEKGIRLIVIIIEESPSYQLPAKFYPTFF
jgi:hypothetical protein